MSVNLHLCIEVKDYDEAQIQAIKNSIREVIAQEQLTEEFGSLEFSRDRGGNERLRIQTDRRFPIGISRAYKWLPEVEQRLKAAVANANGSPCQVRLLGDNIDEDDNSILW